MLKKTMVLTLVLTAPLVGCSAKADAPAAAPSTDAEKSVAAVNLKSADVQAKWWTWATTPSGVNPVTDETGAQCAKEQPQEMWLVAGTFGGAVHRQCTIPAGRPVVGPVVNLVSGPEDCEAFLAGAEGEVVLDGGKVAVTEVAPVSFEFSAQAGNPSGFEPGRNKGSGCGLWFSTGPLKPGAHTLVINGKSGDFAVQATYNLTVKDAADL